jgi:hypothetical protein
LLIVPAVAKTVAPAKATKPTVFFIDGNKEVPDLFSEASFVVVVVVAMSGCCSFAFIYLYVSVDECLLVREGRGKKRSAIGKKKSPLFFLIFFFARVCANATKKSFSVGVCVRVRACVRGEEEELSKAERACVSISLSLSLCVEPDVSRGKKKRKKKKEAERHLGVDKKKK